MDNAERDEMLRRIDERTNRIDKSLALLAGVQQRHDHSLYGNGRPGLCQRVDELAIQQRDCPARANMTAAAVSNRMAAISLVVAIAAALATILKGAFG